MGRADHGVQWPRGVLISLREPRDDQLGPGLLGLRLSARPLRPRTLSLSNSGDGRDHVLRRVLSLEESDTDSASEIFGRDELNPFLQYRELLHSYRSALDRGTTDGEFVEAVAELDAAVAGVDGVGFRETPLLHSASLARELGLADVWVKDDLSCILLRV